MAVAALAKLALSGPVPVHAVIGANASVPIDDLTLNPKIRFEPSVRQAGILLVAGALREEDRDDLRRLHDQMPHPRATVFWRAQPDPHFEAPIVLEAADDPAEVIADTYRRLLRGDRPSERDLQPNEPPNPWRGKGDFGQGGEGMMGGTPYGRPMAMTGDDLRDGLALDPYTAEFGPFLPVFPPGLKLGITLQGDVIQSAKVLRPPTSQNGFGGAAGALRLIARQLRILGLPGHATRLLRTAATIGRGGDANIAGLRRFVEWSGAHSAVSRGLGEVAKTDVRARLVGWWKEAAGEGGARTSRGAIHTRLVDLLPGLEWDEAMLVINSFDPETLIEICPVENGEDDDGHEHHDHGGHDAHEHHHHGHGGA